MGPVERGQLGAVRALLDAGARADVAADRLMTDHSLTEQGRLARKGVLPHEVGFKGLHSSTFRLNVSAFCGIGGAFRGCLGGV